MKNVAESTREAYRRQRVAHWDRVAHERPRFSMLRNCFHRRMNEIYRFLIAPGLQVLEIGCGQGDLLASLKPSRGVGVDFSAAAIEQARERHPGLEFVLLDAHDLAPLSGVFDVIVLSNTVNDLWDVQAVFEQLPRLCHPGTRIVVDYYSQLWELPLRLAQAVRLALPTLPQNWLTLGDVTNLLNLAGFDVIRSWQEVLFPLPIPLLEGILNRFVVRFWPFRDLALANVTIARPVVPPPNSVPSVSIVVPARNEAGNIPEIIRRVPSMGAGTELIFVEGHSRDDTYAVIEREIGGHPERKMKLLRQTGIGKADAVRRGFAEAGGELLIILDADMTVAPEDLPRFYAALVERRGEFINGVRLVYPLERQAMRFLNLLGNKFFGLAFSWLLGQEIKDTLCGTKALWRGDYERIAANRAYFGDFDPFGDFDLLFGAAKLNLKIVDMPIRYHERTYGRTNIDRWRHGWLLLRMVAFAARAIKFI